MNQKLNNGITKESTSNSRLQFLPYLNRRVHCTGKFAGVNIHTNEYGKAITILFHDLQINNIPCDHVWVFYNKNFKKLNIEFGCVMEFDAVVQKYKHDERLGIGDCTDIKIIQNGTANPDELSLKINTIKYDNSYVAKNEQKVPAHIQFIKDYQIKSGSRVELKYDSDLSSDSKVFFNLYINGNLACEPGTVYFVPTNKYGIVIGKYFIPVKEKVCHSLSLIYLRQLIGVA